LFFIIIVIIETLRYMWLEAVKPNEETTNRHLKKVKHKIEVRGLLMDPSHAIWN